MEIANKKRVVTAEENLLGRKKLRVDREFVRNSIYPLLANLGSTSDPSSANQERGQCYVFTAQLVDSMLEGHCVPTKVALVSDPKEIEALRNMVC